MDAKYQSCFNCENKVFLTRDGWHNIPHLAVSSGHLLQVEQEAVDYAEKEGKARNAGNIKHIKFFNIEK